jgi:hypothetical protein
MFCWNVCWQTEFGSTVLKVCCHWMVWHLIHCLWTNCHCTNVFWKKRHLISCLLTKSHKLNYHSIFCFNMSVLLKRAIWPFVIRPIVSRQNVIRLFVFGWTVTKNVFSRVYFRWNVIDWNVIWWYVFWKSVIQ